VITVTGVQTCALPILLNVECVISRSLCGGIFSQRAHS